MSLKAKIEAVIYAAEEPVTLAQLSVLFQEEALDLRRARAAELAAAEAYILQGEGAQAAEPASGTEPDRVPHAAPVSDPDRIDDPEAEQKRQQRLLDREAREEVRGLIEALIEEYATGDRGMEIREIAGGYRVATKPEYHDAVRGFIRSLKPPMKLSLQALETLAVVAYKQPITAPEVSEIRGVDSAGVLGSLISRKLITTAGRKQVIGRPILYRTTKEFLLRFGLRDINELPSMEEFEKMAGELESEPLPFEEGKPAPDAAEGLIVTSSVTESGENAQTVTQIDTNTEIQDTKAVTNSAGPRGERISD